MNKCLSTFFLTINTVLLSTTLTPSIPENVDDFLYGLRAACMPEELLSDRAFTQLIIDYLITLPHTKDNPIFAAAKLATKGAALRLRDYLQDLKNIKLAEHELVIACRNNDLVVINMLLQVGVNPNVVIERETPLTICVKKNNIKALKMLLYAGANNFAYKALFEDIPKVLLEAALQDNLEALELLLKSGADPEKKHGLQILDFAHNKEIMKDFLLQLDYNELYEIDHSQDGTAVGYWPLRLGYSPEVKKYIADQVNSAFDIDEQIINLYFDIQLICTWAPQELEWLIQQLARSTHGKYNFIYAAAKLGNTHGPKKYEINTGVSQWLTEYLKHPEHMKQAEQELFIAAGNNDIWVIETLINAGVPVRARTKRGLTALDYARMRQSYLAEQLLVKYEALERQKHVSFPEGSE